VAPAPSQPAKLVRLIALFKLFKALLLVAVALGALHLVRAGVAAGARQLFEPLAMSTDRGAVQKLISLLSGLGPRKLQALAIGAFAYSVLYLVEGVGLWLEKRWAEYLIAIATLLFVPLEVVALVHHLSFTRATALTTNLLVAAYMIHRLRLSESREKQA
jgi:uncharacterized membrane protein (DUF2068 family)